MNESEQILDEILAEYFTWRGEAIHEVNQTSNYKRMKAAILQHYRSVKSIEDAMGEYERGPGSHQAWYEGWEGWEIRNKLRDKIRKSLGLEG